MTLAAQLCLAVLGVLAVTSEYATGTFRTSLIAAPRRGAVLVAKTVVVAGVAGIAGLASVFATSGLTRAIVGNRPVRGFTADGVHAVPLLLAQSASILVAALVGLALGVVLRHTAGAVVSVVALVYVVPMFAQSLPAPWDARVNSVMPNSLPGQLAGTGDANSIYGSVLSPPVALVVMAAYVIVPLGAAAVLIRRRDT